MAHELKHVIDHRHVDLLYAGNEQAEFAADCFAAALLMPKREVKHVYGQNQSLVALASTFAVSPLAMARRLQHLGLREQLPPRSRPQGQTPRRPGTYYRPATPVRELEAVPS